MRPLSPEEAELWARVAASIRPLPGKKFAPQGTQKARETPRPVPVSATDSSSPPAKRQRARPIGERTLDGRWDKRLRSGDVVPDRVLDLHGLNLEGAWAAIDRSLELAIARGERVLLLITGHHRGGEPPIRRGRIRAAVHDWLAASRHSAQIAAVREAHRRHGGGGSLYLILRRKGSRGVTLS